MAYNPYSAINAIYNLKKTWDSANKAGDNAKKNKAAENAQVFYNQLKNNGYGDAAKDLSAVDASGAKYILDQYSAKNTGVDNTAFNTSMQGAVDKNNTLAGYIDSDRTNVQNKYNDIYNYANSDVTKTDEYKSTYNKMMAKYDLSALQGRNNAVASGGASNGGNIDSYAAANAMRQQAALTAQGQVIAHQAGLDAYNARVSNVSNILNNLGVYNKGTYDEMNNTIANDMNIAQQYFANSETAKNNEVARLKEQAAVTGNVPLSWIIKNDAIYSEFLNEDGTFKKEKEGTDIQALINRYKAIGDMETAEKLAAVRSSKIDGNFDVFGKYINEGDLGTIKIGQTEAARQFNMTDATNRYGIDNEVDLGKYGYDTQKKVSDNEVELGKYGYDTQKKVSDNEVELGKYGYDTQKKVSDNEVELGKYGYDTQKKVSDNEVELGKYGYDTEKEMSLTTNVPTLTAAQATNAIKNGEISQGVIDAYNYYYQTNYTVDNPPNIKKESDNKKDEKIVSDTNVKKWVEIINKSFKETLSDSSNKTYDYSLFKEVEPGKYQVVRDKEFVISKISSSDNLTTAQKNYLFEVFGINSDDLGKYAYGVH